MARSGITSIQKQAVTDDGSVLVSKIYGEQLRFTVNVGWVTNLNGYTITCEVMEGLNQAGAYPSSEDSTPVKTVLPVIDNVTTDNSFEIVFPKDLGSDWDAQPTPNNPVYGFLELSIADTGTGDSQQIWKPMRGLVEIRYSTEGIA